MQRDYLLQDFKLKQDSIFDMGELYKTLFRWFENKGYAFYEKSYQETEAPDGKQLQIYWYAEKKIDAYVAFVIEISYLVTGLTKIEIERGGVKVKTNKGAVEFRITTYLLKDYAMNWSSSPLMRLMRRVYDHVMIRERLSRFESELDTEVKGFIDEARSFLALHTV